MCWVCASEKQEDLDKTDAIATVVLQRLKENSPEEIQQQMQDNIKWIQGARENKLVVGSQGRILYADALGRIEIAKAFNDAIAKGEIGTVVLGRDHHKVSGDLQHLRRQQVDGRYGHPECNKRQL